MMLHGAGGSAEFAAEETGWTLLARREGFAVVYPEAMALRPDKVSKFLTNPQEWHDGSGRGRHDDVGFLAAILDDLSERIDPTQVYLTGFSNGAGMAFRFAAERAERIAALAPVAGHCWIDPHPRRAIPTFYLVGGVDPLVPIPGGTVFTPWGNVETRPAVTDTLHRWGTAIGHAPGSQLFSVRVVPGHGHHWPGGRGLLGERLGGPASTELDATAAIWAFFRSFSRLT